MTSLVIACSRAAEDDRLCAQTTRLYAEQQTAPGFFFVATAIAVSSSGKSLFNRISFWTSKCVPVYAPCLMFISLDCSGRKG